MCICNNFMWQYTHFNWIRASPTLEACCSFGPYCCQSKLGTLGPFICNTLLLWIILLSYPYFSNWSLLTQNCYTHLIFQNTVARLVDKRMKLQRIHIQTQEPSSIRNQVGYLLFFTSSYVRVLYEFLVTSTTSNLIQTGASCFAPTSKHND